MSFMDKAKNAAQKLMGEGKEAAGEHTNDPNMAAEGQKDQVAGDLLVHLARRDEPHHLLLAR